MLSPTVQTYWVTEVARKKNLRGEGENNSIFKWKKKTEDRNEKEDWTVQVARREGAKNDLTFKWRK